MQLEFRNLRETPLFESPGGGAMLNAVAADILASGETERSVAGVSLVDLVTAMAASIFIAEDRKPISDSERDFTFITDRSIDRTTLLLAGEVVGCLPSLEVGRQVYAALRELVEGDDSRAAVFLRSFLALGAVSPEAS